MSPESAPSNTKDTTRSSNDWDRIETNRKGLGRQYSSDSPVWIKGCPQGLQMVEAPEVVLEANCPGLTINTGRLIVLEPDAHKVLTEDSHSEEIIIV